MFARAESREMFSKGNSKVYKKLFARDEEEDRIGEKERREAKK